MKGDTDTAMVDISREFKNYINGAIRMFWIHSAQDVKISVKASKRIVMNTFT